MLYGSTSRSCCGLWTTLGATASTTRTADLEKLATSLDRSAAMLAGIPPAVALELAGAARTLRLASYNL